MMSRRRPFIVVGWTLLAFLTLSCTRTGPETTRTDVLVIGATSGGLAAALAAARIVPTTMAMGEAAGIAAAVCVDRGVTPVDLIGDPALVRLVQQRLLPAGATIEHAH